MKSKQSITYAANGIIPSVPSKSSSSQSSGIGFVGLLTIVFITLKLLGKIDWSWWWVLSPLWISACLVVLILLGVLAIYLAVYLAARRLSRRSPIGRAASEPRRRSKSNSDYDFDSDGVARSRKTGPLLTSAPKGDVPF